jgi:peptide/nickel transport system substrate-binding protein
MKKGGTTMRQWKRFLKGCGLGLFLLLILTAGQRVHAAESVLRVVLDQDLKILDPFWTTAHVSRNHGYLIYDTLFSLDEKLVPRPQMVDTYTVSKDHLVYTFTLREGLEFHDGQAVRAADCVASLKRWGARDMLGQKMFEFVKSFEVVNDKTFRLTLSSPFGLVLDALAKADSNVPFIMPERVAKTDPFQQITDYTGSGPFIMAKDQWMPGNKVVYLKNKRYKPRPEPPSMLAGGKIPGVDRIEFIFIPDTGTAFAAILAGEVDYYHEPPMDQVKPMDDDPNVTVKVLDTLGSQGLVRFNHLHPPFNNKKARQAVLWATHQEDYMKTVVGNPKYYKICPAYFMCGTPLETDVGSEALMGRDLEKAKQLLKESGYDGRPVIVLDPADKPFHHAITLITVAQLRKIGMNVDVQSMPMATVMQRRQVMDPPDKGGWNMFHTDMPAMSVSSPVTNAALNSRCDRKNWPGWPCNEKIEKLRDQYVREPDAAKRKAIGVELQKEAFDFVPQGIYGQYVKLTAVRDSLKGVLFSPVPIFWNITK